MNEDNKQYYYRLIDEILHRSSEEQSIDDILYLLRSLLDDL